MLKDTGLLSETLTDLNQYTAALLKQVYCHILSKIKCSLGAEANSTLWHWVKTAFFGGCGICSVSVLCLYYSFFFYPLDWHFFEDPCVHTRLYFKMTFHMTVLLEPNKHSLSNTSNNRLAFIDSPLISHAVT